VSYCSIFLTMACGATLKRSLDFDPLHSPGQHSPKRRRCIPMNVTPTTPPAKVQRSSAFGEVSPKLSSDQIAANIANEVKRFYRRKEQTNGEGPSPGSSPPRPSFSPPPDALMPQSCASAMASTSSSSSFFNALSPTKRDTPLFTFRQVSHFCERMLKEREDQIREQYDQVLTSKLAEQYEAFLKFNYDQIQRRMQECPSSYIS